LTVAVFARPALAQTYNMTDTLEPNAWMGPVTISWNETVGANTTHYSFSNVAAGPQVVTFVGTPPPFYQSSYDVYCVDMYHFDQSPTQVNLEAFDAVSNLTDFNKAFDGLTQAQWNDRLDQAAWLYTEYNPTVQGASGLSKAEDGAALQLAIWDIMAGPTSGFTFGNGGVNGTEFSFVQSLTSKWYNSVGYNLGDGTLFQTNRRLDPVNGQDLLGPPPMAPESSSMALLAFALAPLALFAIRKRRLAAKAKS
jgi:hypothetical protein